MRAQLSLEFLVYLSVSGLALLFAVGVLSVYYGRLSSASNGYANASFLWQISAALYSGADKFTLYVPQSICTANAPSLLTPPSTAYYLPTSVRVDLGELCPSGRTESLSLAANGSTWVLR